LCHPHTCLCSIEGCLKGCPINRGDHYPSFEVKNFQFVFILIEYYIMFPQLIFFGFWWIINRLVCKRGGGGLVASRRRLREMTKNMLLIIVQRTWYEKCIMWKIFLFIYFGDRFRFDYLKSFWNYFGNLQHLVLFQVCFHNIFFYFMKFLHKK
jgi:hypothetical protein